MIVKFALCLSLFAFCVLGRPEEYPPPELLEFIDPLHETCTKKLGVSDEEVKNYQMSDNSKKMMCYMKCLMIESQWAKEDETINYDYIIENVHPKLENILLPVLEKCHDISGGEECVKSYNFHACLQKADPVCAGQLAHPILGTPLDYFLWGYVKSHVYSSPFENFNELKDNITTVCSNIPPELLIKVTSREFLHRLECCAT